MLPRPNRPVTPARAYGYIVTNQLVTPGLGSILGGRYLAGAGQLVLATLGVGLVLVWFFQVLREYYSQMGDSPLTPQPHGLIGLAGFGIFVVAWIWAGFSSLGMYRESKKRAAGRSAAAAGSGLTRKAIMYKIIGGDGKSYGPVSAEQIQAWIADKRVNGATQVQVAGAADWKLLGDLPEFAGWLKPSPPVLASAAEAGGPTRTTSDRASNKIAAGICGILLGGFGVHKFILGYTGAGLVMLLITVLTCGIGGVVFSVIGLIEGVIYLTKSDEEFVLTYVDGRKEWF